MKTSKQTIQDLLEPADIKINGDRPWDIQIHNEDVYDAVLSGGSLAFGETYMAGLWDCQAIDEMISRIFSSNILDSLKITPSHLLLFVRAYFGNLGSKSKAFEIAEKHYNIGNDLFERMLDKRLVYTCGYWKEASNLDEAQEAKLDLVCKKIGLKKGDHILDIGCGWGSFAKFAAEKYGAHVIGITVSAEQVKLAKELCLGLPVEILLQDYRDTKGQFDHIVSLGMFEHVGEKNYRTYMEVARRCLKDDGFFLLHTIGCNISLKFTDPWIEKYIFPNSMLPSIAQIGKSMERLFVMEDWHNFSADYDKTLMVWFENFDKHWPEIKSQYSEEFYRMWKFYLTFMCWRFQIKNKSALADCSFEKRS